MLLAAGVLVQLVSLYVSLLVPTVGGGALRFGTSATGPDQKKSNRNVAPIVRGRATAPAKLNGAFRMP